MDPVESQVQTVVTTNQGSPFGLIIILLLVVFLVVSLWKLFTKAGEPGWASIIPIYNYIVLLKIAGKPLWWILLLFIPLVNLYPMIMVPLAVAEKFGKSVAFGVGMLFLPFIFYPMLAFGDAEYSA